MKRKFRVILTIISVCVFISAAEAVDELVVYSGRSKSLVEPIIKKFEQENDIKVNVKYGNTAQLALTLMEEVIGERVDEIDLHFALWSRKESASTLVI